MHTSPVHSLQQILSYKMVARHVYAAASEAADLTLAPILTPESHPASTQHRGILPAGQVWLTALPFQLSLGLADFQIVAALQLLHAPLEWTSKTAAGTKMGIAGHRSLGVAGFATTRVQCTPFTPGSVTQRKLTVSLGPTGYPFD
jgi:hypothetical protein